MLRVRLRPRTRCVICIRGYDETTLLKCFPDPTPATNESNHLDAVQRQN